MRIPDKLYNTLNIIRSKIFAGNLLIILQCRGGCCNITGEKQGHREMLETTGNPHLTMVTSSNWSKIIAGNLLLPTHPVIVVQCRGGCSYDGHVFILV